MKIFIGNIGNTITADDLFSLFSTYGNVLASHVPNNSTGDSRGFGYVIMANEAEAGAAIQVLNKQTFMGQYISVCEAIYSEKYNNKVTMPVI